MSEVPRLNRLNPFAIGFRVRRVDLENGTVNAPGSVVRHFEELHGIKSTGRENNGIKGDNGGLSTGTGGNGQNSLSGAVGGGNEHGSGDVDTSTETQTPIDNSNEP